MEQTNAEALAEYLRTSGVKVERRLEGMVGVQGEALNVRYPDGYLTELKLNGPTSSQGDD